MAFACSLRLISLCDWAKWGVEVSSTEGILSIECDRPRVLLRDLLTDYLSDIHAPMQVGRAPLDYSIRSVEHSKRHHIGVSGPAPIPDNVPLTKGMVLVETTRDR